LAKALATSTQIFTLKVLVAPREKSKKQSTI
jgi:hypothetical protein